MGEGLEQSPLVAEPLAGDGFVGAVDLGGTKILAAVVSPDGRVVARAKKSTGRNHGAGPVIDRIAECVREAAKGAGIEAADLRAVGIGAPGPVIPETGVVTVAVNLGWHDVPLRAELEQRLGVPVVVDNDVRVAVLAEHVVGAGRGAASLVGMWVGTGIGGGVVVNGEIVPGTSNAAGEVGHMTIKAGGPVCACGARGHLEPLASRSAVVKYLARRVKKGHKSALTHIVDGDVATSTSGDIAKAYRQGDKLVVEAIHRSTKYLSMGIASVANLLNPSIIVLGGGLVDALGEPYLRQVRHELEGRPLLAATRAVKVVQAALGDDAGIIGGSLVARHAARNTARPMAAVETAVSTEAIETR